MFFIFSCNSIAPVSYTHLDVYKRQAQDSGFIATDDASLVEEFSTAPVKVVIGSYENIKITTPEDL